MPALAGPRMIDDASPEPPIAIDRMARTRERGGSVRLRLSGRWLTDDPPTGPEAPEALLVVELHGRRHRFAADRTPAGATRAGPTRAGTTPSRWRADFTVPSWAVPSHRGQAAVWVGPSEIAIDPPGGTAPAAQPGPEEGGGGEPPAASAPTGVASVAPREGGGSSEPAPDAGRFGPLAGVLLKEKVATLHGELDRRSAEAAQLRSALAGAQSELDARAAREAGLEATHDELRQELEQLTSARDELRREVEQLTAARDESETALARVREQLASAHISRDAAISEAGGLRPELERLSAELTVMREQVSAHAGDLGDAQRLLADARALTAQLRGDAGGAA